MFFPFFSLTDTNEIYAAAKVPDKSPKGLIKRLPARNYGEEAKRGKKSKQEDGEWKET